METTIQFKDEFLWNRLQGFSLDASDADFPFSKKLAKEENWTPDFTKKAIEEYKKFIYLCCILPHGASPSKIVDKVWHMHLIYTQNYWEEFCPQILRRKLHHHPSKGGQNEKDRHQDWFLDTLRQYKTIFQKEAPEDIWQEKIQEKNRKNGLKKFRILPLFMIPFLLSSCLGEILSTLGILFFSILGVTIFGSVLSLFPGSKGENSKDGGGAGGCGGGSSCGGGCGGGCGGCGGCGG